jgi:aminoglycoside phosphotransferase (APT) family kinase protein
MAMFKKGDKVRLKVAVPEGEVAHMRMDEDGTIWYLMSWTNGDVSQERWFTLEELESVE